MMNLTNTQDMAQAIPAFLGRAGNPRTDDERRKRHKSLYGSSELPPRGTGRLMTLLGQRR
jgi:hypothetical protein